MVVKWQLGLGLVLAFATVPIHHFLVRLGGYMLGGAVGLALGGALGLAYAGPAGAVVGTILGAVLMARFIGGLFWAVHVLVITGPPLLFAYWGSSLAMSIDPFSASAFSSGVILPAIFWLILFFLVLFVILLVGDVLGFLLSILVWAGIERVEDLPRPIIRLLHLQAYIRGDLGEIEPTMGVLEARDALWTDLNPEAEEVGWVMFLGLSLVFLFVGAVAVQTLWGTLFGLPLSVLLFLVSPIFWPIAALAIGKQEAFNWMGIIFGLAFLGPITAWVLSPFISVLWGWFSLDALLPSLHAVALIIGLVAAALAWTIYELFIASAGGAAGALLVYLSLEGTLPLEVGVALAAGVGVVGVMSQLFLKHLLKRSGERIMRRVAGLS